jgi:transcriptional regulator with XRE-family HTH domain
LCHVGAVSDLAWFARALRSEQTHRGLSQRGLAEFLGRPLITVQRWLSGERHPAFPELNDVAEKLGWDLKAGLPRHIKKDSAPS